MIIFGINATKAACISASVDSTKLEISLDVFEDSQGNLNHKLFITSLDKQTSDKYCFQTVQKNNPIYTSVYRHFMELEKHRYYYNANFKWFFSSSNEYDNLQQWMIKVIIPNFKKTDAYSTLISINDFRINEYIESLLNIHPQEDIENLDFDVKKPYKI